MPILSGLILMRKTDCQSVWKRKIQMLTEEKTGRWNRNWIWNMHRVKIVLPEDYEQQDSFAVQKHHLDTNHHVNNCQYVQMAMDYLPENFKIHQMRAEYKQQARLNDVICPARAVDENKTTVLLNDQKGEPYAVVEFK